MATHGDSVPTVRELLATADEARLRLALIATCLLYPEICPTIQVQLPHGQSTSYSCPTRMICGTWALHDIVGMEHESRFTYMSKLSKIIQDLLRDYSYVGHGFVKILSQPPITVDLAHQLSSLRFARLQRALSLRLKFKLPSPYTKEPRETAGTQIACEARSGSRLLALPVELLDMVIANLSDLKPMRLTSRMFNKLILEHPKFPQQRVKAHFWFDGNLPETVLKSWGLPVLRQITSTVILEIPRTKRFYRDPNPAWNHPLQDDTTSIRANDRCLRLVLELITSLPNLQRLYFVHNTCRAASGDGSTGLPVWVLEKDTCRGKLSDDLLARLDDVMRMNIEHGLMGYSLGLAETQAGEFVDHYVFQK